MKLRAKTGLIVAATLAGLTLLLLVAARVLVMASFDGVEADAMRENIDRASRALFEDVTDLEHTTHDYAAWDETYRFVEDRHPEYLGQLPTESQTQVLARVIALLDLQGGMLHQRLLDVEAKQHLPAPTETITPLVDPRLLVHDPAVRRGRSGIVLLPDGVWLVAAWPILDHHETKPARGTLVMARPLDAPAVRRLAETTRLDIEVGRLDERGTGSGSAGSGPTVTALSDETIVGQSVLSDVYGARALLLKVRMARVIHQRALVTLDYVKIALAVVGVVFGASMLGLIQSVVLTRLQKLAASLEAIHLEKDLAKRVEVAGHDEIAELGASVNDLLGTIDGSQRALRESEERYALAARAANDGLWDWNVQAGEIYFSPRWKAMLGHAEDEIGSRPEEWMDRVHPDDLGALRDALDAAARGSHSEHEHRIRNKSGEYLHVLARWVATQDPEGSVTRRVGSLSDVSKRRAAEDRLRHEALYDGLTGLPNRALLLDRLRQSLARSKRHPELRCGLLFLDVDRFKFVNDSLGHSVGDELLREVARRIERCVRPEDTVARLGGDEFTVLLENVPGAADANHAAERIQKEVGSVFRLGEIEVFATVSIGIAISTPEYKNPEELIRDADTAMYRAKAGGKARHEIFDNRMHAQAKAILQMESDLRRALDRGEFEVYYQPIVHLEKPDIVGFEALVRWHHPAKGLVLPGEFIPLSEETGLIVPLGRWVLEQACRDMRAWQDDFPRPRPLALSVNLSARQLVEPTLVEAVETILRRTGFPGTQLHLEVTESVIMQQPKLFTVVLGQLKELGLHISIDDFGTGYSSLSYLHLFPVDALKIDRSFVSSMQSLDKQKRIVETIVLLARNLGIDVIAEGVEGDDQHQALRSLGCELAQGFHFSRPVAAPSARRMVESGLVAGGFGL